MFKKLLSIAFGTMLFSSMFCNSAEASEQVGTMGQGYKKYIAQEDKQENKASNQETMEEAAVRARDHSVLDLSEWQGTLTSAQVQKLKSNYDFIILRVQYGSDYKDKTFATNAQLLEANNMKYGVYSYSMYEDPSDARVEARALYNRAPNARFYINDYEEDTVTSGDANDSTLAWLDEMRKYSGSKKVLLYSYEDFMEKNIAESVSSYDGFWLAAYQDTEPEREHILWQYTDSYYSEALDQNVDANVLGPNVETSWLLS